MCVAFIYTTSRVLSMHISISQLQWIARGYLTGFFYPHDHAFRVSLPFLVSFVSPQQHCHIFLSCFFLNIYCPAQVDCSYDLTLDAVTWVERKEERERRREEKSSHHSTVFPVTHSGDGTFLHTKYFI